MALLLRALLGVGARAEIVRYLYTTAPGEASVAEVAFASAFGKRNTGNTLRDLASAKAVRRITAGNEHRYTLFADAWDPLLGAPGPEYRPDFVDWISLLDAAAQLVHWSARHRETKKSDYLLASDARQLVDDLRSAFDAVRIPVPDATGAHGEAFLPVFDALLQNVAAALNVEPSDAF